MSDVFLNPVAVQTPRLKVDTGLEVRPRPNLGYAMSPLRLVAYDIDNYRIRNGWPQAIPDFDLRAAGMISVEGDKLYERVDPMTVEIDADLRWIAHPDYYDPVSLRWLPYQDKFGSCEWVTATNFAPVMEEEYNYRIGSQLVTQSCLNFDPDNNDHFWSSFSGALAGSYGFTFYMVASVRDTNDTAGLLCPGRSTPAGVVVWDEPIDPKTVNFTVDTHMTTGVAFNKARSKALLDIGDMTARQAPLFIFLVIRYPQSRLVVARGKSDQREESFDTGQEVSFNSSFVLGRTNGSLDGCANMSLFECGFFTDTLGPSQITSKIAQLSGIYGGSQSS